MGNTQLNDQLAEIIFELSRSMKEEMTFDSDTLQLTVLQFQTLIFIKKNKATLMGNIADKFKISLPTATVLTDKLATVNLIKRDRSEIDRRIVNVSLTEKGESLLKEAMKQRHKKISKMLSYLRSEDKKQLLRILTNLSIDIKKAYEK